MKNNAKIYLDHAAATPLHAQVYEKMHPFFADKFFNPSSIYLGAEVVRREVEKSKTIIADILGTRPECVIATSGGTESSNLAVQGVVRKYLIPGRGKIHAIATSIEHSSVLEPLFALKKLGLEVTLLPVGRDGKLDIGVLMRSLRQETVLVSIMYANNEIGVINPISDIGREILKWRKANNTIYPYFHTDACHAAGYLDLNVDVLHVDLMTLNAGKIYGPKGSGILYKRQKVKIEPLIYGGGQENSMRSGTTNVAGIVGMAAALAIAQKKRETETDRILKLRDYFWSKLQVTVPGAHLNGSLQNRLPNNLNVAFDGIDADEMVIYLDVNGIVCSSGSACSSGPGESHVLKAMKISRKRAAGSVRFTLGRDTRKWHINRTVGEIQKIRNLLLVDK